MKISITQIKSKEVILIQITSLFWIISKAISSKLWLSDRVFPILPPFECSPILSNQFHLILFISSLIGLIVVFFLPK